jgi:hypothetical protein
MAGIGQKDEAKSATRPYCGRCLRAYGLLRSLERASIDHAEEDTMTTTFMPQSRRSSVADWRVPHGWLRRFVPYAGLYGFVLLFFLVVWISGEKQSPLNLATALVYLTIRLLGVIMGVRKLRQARFSASETRHWMLLAFCAALFVDAIGAVIWLAYNLRGVLVPYPSLADIGYAGDTILWTAGLILFFSVLDTTPREELGSFNGLLTGVWSLTIVVIGLINGSAWASVLPKVAMDIFYPVVWALNCALAGSILFGPQHKRLRPEWRWFVILVYCGSLITFLTNLAYVITAASPADSPASKYLYYNGGPLDFLFATGDFFMMLAVVFLPLGRPVQRAGENADPDAQPALEETSGFSFAAASHAPVEDVYRRLVDTLEDEVQLLRRELELHSGVAQDHGSGVGTLHPRAAISVRSADVRRAREEED